MKYTAKQIDKARQILDQSGYLVGSLWHTADIEDRATEEGITLTPEQVQDVKEAIDSEMDANNGINWDVISYHINNVVSTVTK